MVRRILCFFMLLSFFILVGCQDKMETVMGYWKSVSPGPSGKIETRIFEKDKIHVGGIKNPISVNYKEADGNITAYLEQTSWIITIIDDNTIMIENPYVTKGKFVRTTPDEVKELNKLKEAPESQPQNKNWKPF